MKNEMLTVAQVSDRIRNGDILVLAGAEALLAQLPAGKWIGGTTVYFVTDQGGAEVRDRLFCTTFLRGQDARARLLDAGRLPELAQGYAPHGVTMILIPAYSAAHAAFAVEGPSYPGLFDQPVVGWVTGVPVDDIGQTPPKVFNGATATAHTDGAALLHVTLPAGVEVDLDILNIFSPGQDPALTFTFDTGGFTAHEALVEGRRVRLAAYLAAHQVDTQLPLVANYAGALINVSIESVDPASGEVRFFAPVVAGVEYRHARALGPYPEAFARAAGDGTGGDKYSCNCILNYLYGDLAGKTTGPYIGPVTFGEIAYILLNQTLVHMDLRAA